MVTLISCHVDGRYCMFVCCEWHHFRCHTLVAPSCRATAECPSRQPHAVCAVATVSDSVAVIASRESHLREGRERTARECRSAWLRKELAKAVEEEQNRKKRVSVTHRQRQSPVGVELTIFVYQTRSPSSTVHRRARTEAALGPEDLPL